VLCWFLLPLDLKVLHTHNPYLGLCLLPHSHLILRATFTSGILVFGSAKMETLVGLPLFFSKMHPPDAMLCFIVAAFATNILTLIMIFELPAAFPRPMPPTYDTPTPSSRSLNLDSSERANTEIQDSPPPTQDSPLPTQVENKPTGDSLATSSSGNDTNPEKPALSPGRKFGFATIVLTFIAFSLYIQFAYLQLWQQCYSVPIAWWDVSGTVLWTIFIFDLGIASLALGRWLMLLCDLWGEAGSKIWLIQEYFLFMWIAIAIFVPLALLSSCFQALREWYRNRPKSRRITLPYH
jgi:hypothetical protein